MMGIVVPETCWAYNKYNKIISRVYLVFILQLKKSLLLYTLVRLLWSWRKNRSFRNVWKKITNDFHYIQEISVDWYEVVNIEKLFLKSWQEDSLDGCNVWYRGFFKITLNFCDFFWKFQDQLYFFLFAVTNNLVVY